MTQRLPSTLPDPAAAAGEALGGAEPAAEAPPAHSVLAVLREWLDALIIAFVLAMFVRIFIVELFKIPTGSMTPTLVGGRVADVDFDHDGRKDLLLFPGSGYRPPLLFLNDGRRLVARGRVDVGLGEVRSYERYDRILVDKLAYWLSPPRRGDIVVFKVPRSIWQSDKPIYIKRCVGEPGDTLTFTREGGLVDNGQVVPAGRLVANGQVVEHPDFFRDWLYRPSIDNGFRRQSEIAYHPLNTGWLAIDSIHVPANKIYVFGDNTLSSLDSRYWGGVPLDNVKGRAFFRYYPFSQMRFLDGG